MPIYHLYEWIALDPEIQHLHQIIVPRGQEIQAVEATTLQLTGFKMILNDQYQYIPALLNWNLN
jgi:UDP-N-acetylglucosamine enolpyruvyl transferase